MRLSRPGGLLLVLGVGCVAVAVLGLAGCGGSDSTPAPPPPATRPASTAQTEVTSEILDNTLQTFTVNVGARVTWVNKGAAPHTSSSSGNWESNTLNPGQSFSFTVTKAGKFSYFCQFHAGMAGTVTVPG